MRKHKNIKNFITAALISTLASTGAYGQVAVGAKVGILTGLGLEGRVQIMEQLYGRLGGNYFKYSPSASDGTIDYKFKLTLLTVPLMLDYHPIEDSGFRLSLGVGYNGNNLKGSCQASKPITLYGTTYSVQELGALTSKLTFGRKIAPVFSIGYDSSLINNSPFSFNAELGAMYLGSPKVKVSATGIAAQATRDRDLTKDANESLADVKKYLKILPMITVGFKYQL